MRTALYLAHLNPLTHSHVQIIGELREQAEKVIIMPVIFLKDGLEVNSRSFPFTFEARKKMVEAVFGDAVEVSKNYTFFAPFSRYLPPLISPKSWRLRSQILNGIKGDYFTYTGDRTEGLMLRAYMLHPRTGRRKPASATSSREMLYEAASGGADKWRKTVTPEVAGVIDENWAAIERFAKIEDQTTRVAGMKFPKEGYR